MRLDELVDPPGTGAAAGRAAATVVWLHGMGHDGETMRTVAKSAGLTGSDLRNVYLQAPFRMIGLGRPRPVRAWVHQSVLHLETARWSDLREVVPPLRAVLDRELDRAGEGRVLLAGFSQGASMALILGLSHTRRLAGVAGYATVPPSTIVGGRGGNRVNDAMPVWLGHGQEDWAVPVEVGRRIAARLARTGRPVRWREYAAGHDPFAGAEPDLGRFVREALEPGGPGPEPTGNGGVRAAT